MYLLDFMFMFIAIIIIYLLRRLIEIKQELDEGIE
jgi:hypothetical protein